MVRRRDPGWGETREEAERGERDTFHYTNSAPQHPELNRREWVELEDYVLEAAETLDFRASVFTGPVLRDDDRRLGSPRRPVGFRIPEEFWKVVVMVDAESGELSATGYVLSQGRMIRDIVEARFVYGQFRMYQVQIARIEAETGLDFGRLREFDPLGMNLEARFVESVRVIGGAGDLLLRRRL
jgi:endonuclease G